MPVAMKKANVLFRYNLHYIFKTTAYLHHMLQTSCTLLHFGPRPEYVQGSTSTNNWLGSSTAGRWSASFVTAPAQLQLETMDTIGASTMTVQPKD